MYIDDIIDYMLVARKINPPLLIPRSSLLKVNIIE